MNGSIRLSTGLLEALSQPVSAGSYRGHLAPIVPFLSVPFVAREPKNYPYIYWLAPLWRTSEGQAIHVFKGEAADLCACVCTYWINLVMTKLLVFSSSIAYGHTVYYNYIQLCEVYVPHCCNLQVYIYTRLQFEKFCVAVRRLEKKQFRLYVDKALLNRVKIAKFNFVCTYMIYRYKYM